VLAWLLFFCVVAGWLRWSFALLWLRCCCCCCCCFFEVQSGRVPPEIYVTYVASLTLILQFNKVCFIYITLECTLVTLLNEPRNNGDERRSLRWFRSTPALHCTGRATTDANTRRTIVDSFSVAVRLGARRWHSFLHCIAAS